MKLGTEAPIGEAGLDGKKFFGMPAPQPDFPNWDGLYPQPEAAGPLPKGVSS